VGVAFLIDGGEGVAAPDVDGERDGSGEGCWNGCVVCVREMCEREMCEREMCVRCVRCVREMCG